MVRSHHSRLSCHIIPGAHADAQQRAYHRSFHSIFSLPIERTRESSEIIRSLFGAEILASPITGTTLHVYTELHIHGEKKIMLRGEDRAYVCA